MKTVLVSTRLTETAEYPEVRQALDVRWGSFLDRCGLLGIPVLYRSQLDRYFHGLDPQGILLTGGNDLACVAPESDLSRERDNLELSLIERGLREGLPILGVCRGMQMLASFYGCSPARVDHHAATLHEVRISPEGRLAAHYPERLEVNSFHEFGLRALTPDLRPLALHGSDGTIEAFEHLRDPVLAVMWHPERTPSFCAYDICLFSEFFA